MKKTRSWPLWIVEAPVVVIISLILIPLLVRSTEALGMTKDNSIVLALIFQQASFLCGTFYLKRKFPLITGDSLASKFSIQSFLKSLLWIPAIFLISILGTNISVRLFVPLLGPERLQVVLMQETTRVNVLFLDSWRFFVAAIIVCVVGPISEELFFRGFFLSRVTKTYSKKAGYLLTSLFFALPHFYVVNFIPIFLLSLIFSYIALNEDLWAAVGAHVFFNTILFVITVL